MKGEQNITILIVEVIDLGHVSEENVLPVPQHGGQEDEHGRIIHLSSVALPDEKGLITQLPSPQRQMKRGHNQTFNTISLFLGAISLLFPGFSSLNPCLSAHGVVVQQGIAWESSCGLAALQRCSQFS